jgi:hypothetical protein
MVVRKKRKKSFVTALDVRGGGLLSEIALSGSFLRTANIHPAPSRRLLLLQQRKNITILRGPDDIKSLKMVS